MAFLLYLKRIIPLVFIVFAGSACAQNYPSPHMKSFSVDQLPTFTSCNGPVRGNGGSAVTCNNILGTDLATGAAVLNLGYAPPNPASFTGLILCNGTSSCTSAAVPISPTLGGLGAASLTGYVYCNGASPCTSSTTIPSAAINAPYVGAQATRAYFPNSDVASQYVQARSLHVATDNITTIQKICYANKYVPWNGNHLETNGPATITLRLGVEYPAGTFTQAKFSGATFGTMTSGQMLCSDPVSVTIPQGAIFFLRPFTQATSTDTPMAYAGGVPLDAAGGEAACSTNSDTSMGGAICNSLSAAGANLYPVAIVGTTTKPTILFVGDSRLYGTNDTIDSTHTMGLIPRALSNYGSINVAVPGDSAEVFVTSNSLRSSLQQYVSHVFVEYDINGLGYGVSTVQSSLLSIWNLFPSKKVYQATMDPYSSTTTGCSDAQHQTPSTYESVRVGINNFIRLSYAPLTGYMDAADFTETFRDSGIWQNSFAKADVGIGPGIISTSTSSTAVTGSGGTVFTTYFPVGNTVSDVSGNAIGVVASVTDDAHLTLAANATQALTNGNYTNQLIGLCLHASRLGATGAAKFLRAIPPISR